MQYIHLIHFDEASHISFVKFYEKVGVISEKITFYTEIFTQKVELRIFFSLMKNTPNQLFSSKFQCRK